MEHAPKIWWKCENSKIRIIVWGFHGPGWLWVVGNGSRGYLPLFATLSPQSTCHGPRPGPTCAPQCSCGPLACPATESTRKDPRAKERKMRMCKKKSIWYIVICQKGENQRRGLSAYKKNERQGRTWSTDATSTYSNVRRAEERLSNSCFLHFVMIATVTFQLNHSTRRRF